MQWCCCPNSKRSNVSSAAADLKKDPQPFVLNLKICDILKENNLYLMYQEGFRAESSSFEPWHNNIEIPFGFLVNCEYSNREEITNALKHNHTRAFIVTSDGDIIIGKTSFHKDIITGRPEEILEKGTIVPKSQRINFIHSSQYRNSSVNSKDRVVIQSKISGEINNFLGISYHLDIPQQPSFQDLMQNKN